MENGELKTEKTGAWDGSRGPTFIADQLVVAAGTFNTQKLLHKMKRKQLPQLSDRLGALSRTNSEALTGALMDNRDNDFSRGAAITSSFFPDEHTHIEPVRYGKGKQLHGLLQTIMTDGFSGKERRRRLGKAVLSQAFAAFANN
jgi:cholesterol oxidase